ncbi:hypothetical protein P8H27_05170 [Pseudomonas sp. sp1636]|uniref:hypothetical protein n=1 Tax=Pseudomonas sp. sp1636 TaxID=3036707 RepID=UPI0025A520C4|nr:hypothetical protein [Pseudomonas sp. sp1636]MDM8348284.1 hypothetical protein [Pseudomonas sp. sp1636]
MQTTLLVVGEGPDDKAFISHMKQLYCPRGCGVSVKVQAQDGGSPGNIISNAIRSYRNTEYNRRILLLDADLPPSDAEYKRAAVAGYTVILWRPQCLEGALLEALDEPVQAHETSQQLKQRLHPRLDGRHTEPAAYAELFTRPVLDATGNHSIVTLRMALLKP